MRYYVVPIVGSGVHGDPRRPKYFVDFVDGAPRLLTSSGFQVMDCGAEPVMIVAAETTDTDHASIAARDDVLAAPDDLSWRLGTSDFYTLRRKLRDFGIPSDHLTLDTTYRELLRWITRWCSFHQRYHGRSLGGSLLKVTGLMGPVDRVLARELRLCADSLGLRHPLGIDSMSVGEATKFYADQLHGSTMAGDL